jgi:competence protein ComEC
MPSVGLLPAIALLAGTLAGILTPVQARWPLCALPVSCAVAAAAWRRGRARTTLVALAAGYVAAGAALAADARAAALRPAIRELLEAHIGGFDIRTLGPAGEHDPLALTLRLTEDAAPADGYVALRGRATGIVLDRRVQRTDDGVIVSVSGTVAASRASEWRAGRTLRMWATFRRPARYLDEGVPDFERQAALDGTALLASVKSGLLVDVEFPGTPIEELAARARAHVRRTVALRVGTHSPVSAGIVTAVLIGDRTGLAPDVRERLQAAGTYHVIAISGGNIAILSVLALAGLALLGIRGRPAAVAAIVLLVAYAQVVTAGPSVWRATIMAVLYFTARALDHDAPAWQVTAAAAAAMAALHPLDVRDPGFVLTFGATAALLEGARRGRGFAPRHAALAWAQASIVASLASEAVLMPVSAQAFSRVTAAGIVLNLLAVPLMAIVQVAGTVVVLGDGVDAAASIAGLVAHAAAAMLVGSARLVDLAPWLARRVPPPGMLLLAAYYGSLGVLLAARRRRVRRAAAGSFVITVLAIASGIRPPARVGAIGARPALRVTMLDVGQAEAVLVQMPGGRPMLIDAGGTPFGDGTFDIGRRVLAPSLWSGGVARLHAVLLTHGDPDHIGGAASILDDFSPGELWEGIRLPAHAPMQRLVAAAQESGIAVVSQRAGTVVQAAGARLRILHPQEPDWERQQVRNDDSVVLEVVYGDVALLLTGDIGAEVERALLPRLTPARVRVLKVAHHASRTSTSGELLERWRPQVALISAGRGNTFGHPAPDVLQRLDAIGATVFRTDRHGQITLETDGRRLSIRTYTGERYEPR